METRNLTDVTQLLKQVLNIQKQYDKLAEISGENFNVFSILGLDYNEVKHSRFLGELLNPQGSHGQKGKFLELFVAQMKNRFDGKGWDFNTDNVRVEIEKSTPTQGRIDIYISDGKHQVIIENKIYAADQENQLERYLNFAEKQNQDLTKIHLFYLTLDGCEASENSISANRNTHVKNISYKEFIREWLGDCIEKSALMPPVRESLHQYLNLVKKLTGLTQSDQMAEDIQNSITQSAANFDAAFLIHNNFDEACEKAIKDFWKGINDQLQDSRWQSVENIGHKMYSNTKVYPGVTLFKQDSSPVVMRIESHDSYPPYMGIWFNEKEMGETKANELTIYAEKEFPTDNYKSEYHNGWLCYKYMITSKEKFPHKVIKQKDDLKKDFIEQIMNMQNTMVEHLDKLNEIAK